MGEVRSISTKFVQPVFIAVSGLVATVIGVRATLGVLAVVLVGSASFLPWRTRADEQPDPGRPLGEIDADERATARP